MEDKQLEQMLYDLGQEEIQPSKELIQRTKTAIHNRFLYYLIGISIALNTLTIVGFLVLIKDHTIFKYLIQSGFCVQLIMSILAISGLLIIKNQADLDVKGR